MSRSATVPDTAAPPTAAGEERGLALLIVLLTTALLLGLGSALVLVATTETRIQARSRDSLAALYAAEAVLLRAVEDLRDAADWQTVLTDRVVSTFADGPPGGIRLVAGTSVPLTELTNLVTCGARGPCSDAARHRVTDERPWGRANPRWQLFAYGPAAELLPGGSEMPLAVYTIVWIGPHPFLGGGDPDAGEALWLLAHAYGPGGVRRGVAATVRRTAATVTITEWREIT